MAVPAFEVSTSTPTGRVVRDPVGWFTDGARLKTTARRARMCVECHRTLPTARTPYCSRRCQWRFCGRYFWDSARTFVIHRDRFTCQHCHRRCRVRELEVDHIREIARGGASLDYTNLQTLCRACHREKTVDFLRQRRGSSPANPLPRGEPDDLGPFGDGTDWFPA